MTKEDFEQGNEVKDSFDSIVPEAYRAQAWIEKELQDKLGMTKEEAEDRSRGLKNTILLLAAKNPGRKMKPPMEIARVRFEKISQEYKSKNE